MPVLSPVADFGFPAAEPRHAPRPSILYRRYRRAQAERMRAAGEVVATRNLGANLFGSAGVADSEGPGDKAHIRADEVRMTEVAGGDRAAFAYLVGELSPRILRFARSMLPASPAEADEIVQEAFLRLWQQAPTWQPNGRIATWLHQVVYRLCIDQIRRRRPSVGLEIVETELEDDAPLAEERLIRIEEVRAVREAMARLPERQREALILSHFQDLSQAEASAVLGVGESAYESLLARARRRLRILLIEDSGNGMEGSK